MLTELLLIAALATLNAWAILLTWRSRRSWPTKTLWTAGVLMVPFLGAGVWVLFGPRAVRATPTFDP